MIFPDTGRSTGAYMIFYQGGPNEYGTQVTGPVSQSSAESEYNAACTAGMVNCTHFLHCIEQLVLEYVCHGQLVHLDRK